MILTCSSCLTQFTIDPQLLAPGGRTVRCARCKHQWLAMPPLITLPDAEAAEGFSEKLAPVPADEALASKLLNAGKNAVRNAVIAGILTALILLAPFFFWRYSTLAAQMPSAAEMARADRPVKQEKTIVLDGTPSPRIVQEGGRNLLKIEGTLLNRDDVKRKMPKLVAQGLDATGKVVKEWEIPLKASELEPGQHYPFNFSTPFAEQGVVDIAFHFM
jgi:predicted Zn finger-like uncharacterized protein